jgi:hypothetical protein
MTQLYSIRSVAACLGAALVSVSLGAQQPDTRELFRVTRSAKASASEAASLTAAEMLIEGSARTSNNAPVIRAVVRLRNARTGRIVAQTLSDANGGFSFRVAEPGVYVPELLDENGRILAAGDMLTIELGYTVATLIKVPAQVPAFGWFRDAAGAIVSAASSAGVLAVAATAAPASAIR